MVSKKLRINKPISKSERANFLNESPDINNAKTLSTFENKNAVGRPKKETTEVTTKKTITMYKNDIENLEALIQRCINLGVKDKGISGSIRMALVSLMNEKDETFLQIYKNVR
jgi:hypothetical protein